MKINFSNISERLADTFGDREALINIERKRRYTCIGFHLFTNRIVNMMQQKLILRRGDVWLNLLDNNISNFRRLGIKHSGAVSLGWEHPKYPTG